MTSEFSCQNSVSLSLLHSVLQGQICLLFQVSLEKEMATHSSIRAWRIPWTEELGGLQSTGRKESDTTERPGISWLPTLAFWFLIMERTSFGVLVLEDLVGLHRNVQLQLLQHYWSGHRLGLLWYWMVCTGKKQIILSFLRLHPSTAFQILLLTMIATPFLLRDSCLSSRYNGYLS